MARCWWRLSDDHEHTRSTMLTTAHVTSTTCTSITASRPYVLHVCPRRHRGCPLRCRANLPRRSPAGKTKSIPFDLLHVYVNLLYFLSSSSANRHFSTPSYQNFVQDALDESGHGTSQVVARPHTVPTWFTQQVKGLSGTEKTCPLVSLPVQSFVNSGAVVSILEILVWGCADGQRQANMASVSVKPLLRQCQ